MKSLRAFFIPLLLLGTAPTESPAQQVTGQDLDKVLERADALLEEAKVAYAGAREKSSVEGFVDAGFKLEEARIKYIVLQELASPEKQKIAGDRLRAINQLGKLIHDGKVAISGAPTGSPTEKPPAPIPPDPGKEPAPITPAPFTPGPPGPLDVTKRLPIPEASGQRDAEKLIKELFKDQYAKKALPDRKRLARVLLDQASKSQDDPAALWVLCREAQDISAQNGDVTTALEATEAASRFFDVDGMALRNAALVMAGKTAKAPEDFAALADAMLKLTDEYVMADQYEAAEKASALAVQHARKANDVTLTLRTTSRNRDVTEAKMLFKAMKIVLETLAKTPDDPAANQEMGQYLCFVKGSWDLGVRFLMKGTDPVLKLLAEKETALPSKSPEWLALADGWWDVSEKEKSTLRKTQVVAHASQLYENSLEGATSLQKIKIEKRLDAASQIVPSTGAIDLIRLIDPKRDHVLGEWSLEGKVLSGGGGGIEFARIQVPYIPPTEYTLTLVVERKSGQDAFFFGLASGNSQWFVSFDSFLSTISGIGFINGQNVNTNETSIKSGQVLSVGKPVTVVCSVRKEEILVSIEGRRFTSYKGGFDHLSNPDYFKVPNTKSLFVGANWSRVAVSKMILTPISGQGKKLY